MAKTQDIKRRIRSVKNTMQLTKAMQMVSAAKLRRAQEAIFSARPYAERTQKILRNLAGRASSDVSPLLQRHGDQKIQVVSVAGDKGLCGAFNSHILREADRLIAGNPGKQITISAIGKKSRDYHVRRKRQITRSWIEIFRKVEFSMAAEIGQELIRAYIDKEVDEVHLVYNEFKSAIQSTPVVMQLLPIVPAVAEEGDIQDDYIYEPSVDGLLTTLLPHSIEIEIYRALLESCAAEHAARMTAMDSATNNAGELIDKLTLAMNRVRQASITTEIIEVVSGAAALE